MSLDHYQDVLDFTTKYGAPVKPLPKLPQPEIMLQRVKLVEEEWSETVTAYVKGDVAAFADGIADLLYVVYGTAIAAGVDIRPVWDAVQHANMQKIPPGPGEFKIKKPDGWQAPDVAAILSKQEPLV
jgi:predicted HAD superfamily Cof-like phosphohydrolase